MTDLDIDEGYEPICPACNGQGEKQDRDNPDLLKMCKACKGKGVLPARKKREQLVFPPTVAQAVPQAMPVEHVQEPMQLQDTPAVLMVNPDSRNKVHDFPGVPKGELWIIQGTQVTKVRL